MKKLYMALVVLATALTACNKVVDPYFTAGEDDYPRILNTDIEEQKGGKPSALPNITRDANFTFEAIVTPTAYTTVSWYIDGAKVYEGTQIDMPLVAGTYNVKIVATTTKGKETYRNCTLKVLPLDGDPTLSDDGQSRWFNPGKANSIEGTNIADVTGLEIMVPGTDSFNYIPVEEFSNNGSKLSFTVPASAPLGEYKLIAVCGGTKYGCGVVTVSDEKYVAPGKAVKTLWEGNMPIDYSLKADLQGVMAALKDAKAGDVLTITVKKTENDYHQVCPVVDWCSLRNGGYDEGGNGGRADDNVTEDEQEFEYPLSDALIAVIQGGNEFGVVGAGASLVKITLTSGGGPVTKTLWEGELAIDYTLKADLQGVLTALKEAKAGDVLKITVKKTENDYHQVCPVIDWCSLRNGGYDEGGNGGRADDNVTEDEQEFEYPLSDALIAVIQGGNEFGVVGAGASLVKITLTTGGSAAPGAETVIYTGPSDKLAWSALPIEDRSAIKVGSVLTAYVTADEGGQGGFATCSWMHLNDGSAKWDAAGTDPWAVHNLEAGEQVMEWTVTSLDAMNEQGLAVVGNGIVVNKVTVK